VVAVVVGERLWRMKRKKRAERQRGKRGLAAKVGEK